MIRTLWTVFRKEVMENLRDRRTLTTALLFGPLFGPLLLAATLQMSLSRGERVADEPIEVAVAHAERAANLVAFLEENNVEVQRVAYDDAAARTAVLDKRHKLVIAVPEDFAARLASARPAPLLLYADQSDMFNDRIVERVTRLVTEHGQQIGQLRLLLRGVDPTIAVPVAVQNVDVSTPRSRAVLALGILSYLVIIAMLAGGMYLAIDATAGERERGSLEPLLTTPADPSAIVYGKIAATAFYMFVSLVLTLVACALVLQFIRLENLGMSANLGPVTVLAIIAVVMPLIPLGAALMAVVASFTRSYREAQTYTGAVLLVPTLPLAFLGFLSLKPTLAMMAVPSLSQHFLMTTLLRDEPLRAIDVALSAGVSLALGFTLAWIAGRLYRREAILG